jgi:predicted metalloendopeptidase
MKKQTKKIKHNKSKKITIQDDFYTYINNNWLKNYTIPLDQNSINLFTILQKKIDYQLLDIVKKCEKNPKNIIEENLVHLFQSCVTYNKPLANQQLYYFVQTINDLIQQKNIYEFISWMQHSGFNIPFQIIISNNIYNSKENILNIVRGEFTFNNKNIYLKNNKLYRHYRKEFVLFLKTIFYIVFGKDHSFQVENVLKVETQMSAYLYSSTEDNELENKLNFYSISNLHSSFHLDFSKIFHNLHIECDKKVQVGKPKRGGASGKKFYVYVMDKGKVKKVSFGQAGMSAKINDPKARRAFAARHDCKNKKDRTKPSYWSCRLPRYAKLLGLKSSFSGFW